MRNVTAMIASATTMPSSLRSRDGRRSNKMARSPTAPAAAPSTRFEKEVRRVGVPLVADADFIVAVAQSDELKDLRQHVEVREQQVVGEVRMDDVPQDHLWLAG